MMIRTLIFFVCLLISYNSASVLAKDLPIPRFVTIKFNEVNARTGPANDCPIEWVFIQKGEPVEVIAEYGQWRKIKDIYAEGGWVHSSVISGYRSVVLISKSAITLLKNPDQYDQIVARLLPKIRCSLNKCQGDWCQITCNNYKGWVVRKYLWGVYPDE